MKVEDEQYLPVNEEGNSVFEIPVTVFDEPLEVTADTTAMSRPHEVEYTLTFASSSVAPADAGGLGVAGGTVLAAVLLLAVVRSECVLREREEGSRNEKKICGFIFDPIYGSLRQPVAAGRVQAQVAGSSRAHDTDISRRACL